MFKEPLKRPASWSAVSIHSFRQNSISCNYATKIVYNNVLTKDKVIDGIKGQLINIWGKLEY